MKWQWQADELQAHWHLTAEEFGLLYKKTPHGRLGFVVLLKYFQNEGHFPEHCREIPEAVLGYLAHQVGVVGDTLSQYEFLGRTSKRDRTDILYALMAVFCWQRQMEITDDLIDLLIQVVHNIGKRAENKIDKKLLEDLKLVHGKTGLLFKLAEVAVEQPEGIIKDVLYPKVSLETLKNLVKEYKASLSITCIRAL